MNDTFELGTGGKEALERIHSIGKNLCDNYDPEVLAYVSGEAIICLAEDLLKGNLEVSHLGALKDVALNLLGGYDEEVLAYALGQELDLLLATF